MKPKFPFFSVGLYFPAFNDNFLLRLWLLYICNYLYGPLFNVFLSKTCRFLVVLVSFSAIKKNSRILVWLIITKVYSLFMLWFSCGLTAAGCGPVPCVFLFSDLEGKKSRYVCYACAQHTGEKQEFWRKFVMPLKGSGWAWDTSHPLPFHWRKHVIRPSPKSVKQDIYSSPRKYSKMHGNRRE